MFGADGSRSWRSPSRAGDRRRYPRHAVGGGDRPRGPRVRSGLDDRRVYAKAPRRRSRPDDPGARPRGSRLGTRVDSRPRTRTSNDGAGSRPSWIEVARLWQEGVVRAWPRTIGTDGAEAGSRVGGGWHQRCANAVKIGPRGPIDVGTESSLRRYSPTGTLVWERPIPGEGWVSDVAAGGSVYSRRGPSSSAGGDEASRARGLHPRALVSPTPRRRATPPAASRDVRSGARRRRRSGPRAGASRRSSRASAAPRARSATTGRIRSRS